jgi:hypothetical protein
MTEDFVALDGNAAAGPLTALFAVDPTTIMITCEGCSRESALATLKLYGGAMGLILRCPECDTANLRFVDAGTRVTVDLRGTAELAIPGSRG